MYFLLLLILAVDDTKTFDEQITVEDNVTLAKRYNKLCKSACSNSSTFIAKFFFDTLNYAVKAQAFE